MANYPLEIKKVRAKLDLMIVLLAKKMDVSDRELDDLYKLMLQDENRDAFSFEAITKIAKKEKVPVKNIKKVSPKEQTKKTEVKGETKPNIRRKDEKVTHGEKKA
jgi:hypothetical protein